MKQVLIICLASLFFLVGFAESTDIEPFDIETWVEEIKTDAIKRQKSEGEYLVTDASFYFVMNLVYGGPFSEEEHKVIWEAYIELRRSYYKTWSDYVDTEELLCKARIGEGAVEEGKSWNALFEEFEDEVLEELKEEFRVGWKRGWADAMEVMNEIDARAARANRDSALLDVFSQMNEQQRWDRLENSLKYLEHQNRQLQSDINR